MGLVARHWDSAWDCYWRGADSMKKKLKKLSARVRDMEAALAYIENFKLRIEADVMYRRLRPGERIRPTDEACYSRDVWVPVRKSAIGRKAPVPGAGVAEYRRRSYLLEKRER